MERPLHQLLAHRHEIAPGVRVLALTPGNNVAPQLLQLPDLGLPDFRQEYVGLEEGLDDVALDVLLLLVHPLPQERHQIIKDRRFRHLRLLRSQLHNIQIPLLPRVELLPERTLPRLLHVGKIPIPGGLVVLGLLLGVPQLDAAEDVQVGPLAEVSQAFLELVAAGALEDDRHEVPEEPAAVHCDKAVEQRALRKIQQDVPHHAGHRVLGRLLRSHEIHPIPRQPLDALQLLLHLQLPHLLNHRR
mmetsp:Transcript_46994/g.124438  ORF Transcript_46994/g.124438 Transcript_46994/m.124438 type:complete len:245 (-) Transcript_46994:1341-2075(-)